MKNQTQTVISLLSPRKKKRFAIHQDWLAHTAGITTRQLRMIIERIRRENLIDGYVVVSDLDRGYWLSKDEKEIDKWLHSFLGQAFSMIKTAKTAKKFLKKSNQDKLQTKLKF